MSDNYTDDFDLDDDDSTDIRALRKAASEQRSRANR